MTARWAFFVIAAVSASAGVKEAVAYLEVEVPRWKAENKCYSCHNNGDGARALLLAGRRRGPALEDTLQFLRDPKKWPQDLAPLALIQYTNALAASGADIHVAAQRIAAAQKPDGHWEMDAEAAAGSPATYGPVLGTVLAREILLQAKLDAQRATQWLEQQKVAHPMDLAALVLAFHRKLDVDRLAAMQAKDGS